MFIKLFSLFRWSTDLAKADALQKRADIKQKLIKFLDP